MSIRCQLGDRVPELRIRPETPVGEGAVLEGKTSVEVAAGAEVRKAPRPLRSYDAVEDYDPVLRSHCRLDREG